MKWLKVYEERIDLIEVNITNFGDKIKKYNSAVHGRRSSLKSGSSDLVCDSIREFSERQKRQNNMIFGVAKVVSDGNLSRAEIDTQAGKHIILKAFPKATVWDIEVFLIELNIHQSPDQFKLS